MVKNFTSVVKPAFIPTTLTGAARSCARFAILGLCLAGLVTTTSDAQTRTVAVEPPILSQAAKMIGIKRCLAAIDATARRVTQGATKQDILIDWYRAAPDQGPSFSLTGIEFGTEPVVLSLAAVPTANNRCALLAERISSSTRSCANYAAVELAGYSSNVLLPSISVYVNPAYPTETISLVNAKPGCLVIRRQAIFDWVK